VNKALEALNHAGSLEHDRLLVVLNDNRWSIAKTVGALSRYLNQVRSGPFYNRAKDALHHLIQSIPVIGKGIMPLVLGTKTVSRSWRKLAAGSPGTTR
jgi:1-deoxy-D-xylulose-5-phosphate synthase